MSNIHKLRLILKLRAMDRRTMRDDLIIKMAMDEIINLRFLIFELLETQPIREHVRQDLMTALYSPTHARGNARQKKRNRRDRPAGQRG